MKKFLLTVLITAFAAAALLCGCKGVNYSDHISDKRSNIFIYKDDNLDLKIYCASREEPFNADGICGNVCDIVEIFVSFPNSCETVEISVDGHSGDMNYEAVDKRFTLTYSSSAIVGDGVDVQLTADGNTYNVRALSVLDKGVITCEQALICATEHAPETFEQLLNGKTFSGEIFVRLLYDDGCYYYVGVCDRDKNIAAYLIDGGNGKIISERHMNV